jgi:four helix bundle protein
VLGSEQCVVLEKNIQWHPLPPKRMSKATKDLLVWQKAMDLVVECYQLTKRFPASELYGLTSQIRRAAVSVPANIAEGFGRWHSKDFVRFLLNANGSLKEVETHLLISERLGFLQRPEMHKAMGLSEELGRMLAALRHKLGPHREE